MASPTAANRLAIDVESLAPFITRAARQARLSGQSILASVVLPIAPADPLVVFRAGASISSDRWLWLRTEERFGLVGVGAAWSRDLPGPHCRADASRVWREMVGKTLVELGPTPPGTGPVVLGGFAFDPARPRTALWADYPDAMLALPRLLFTFAGDHAWLTVNLSLDPGCDPEAELAAIRRDGALLESAAAAESPSASPKLISVEDVLPASDWQAIVAEAVKRVRAGAFDKVVLARACQVRADASFDPVRVLDRLRTDYPTCYVYAVARHGACFVGASPEQLAALSSGELQTMALAGSIARGATEKEDRQLGQALRQSAKDRNEHATVVRAIREALTELGARTADPGPPEILGVRNVQHLLTRVKARLPQNRTILDVVDYLHPTPAVGGYPRSPALAHIRDREDLDRGWYAGAIGWLDRRGDGEFAVALRSALLKEDRATLFAGCGIVADSDPVREYAESGWKLQPILRALGGSQP